MTQPLSKTKMKELRALTKRKQRAGRGAFLAEGPLLAAEAFAFGDTRALVATDDAMSRPENKNLFTLAGERGIEVFVATDKQLDELCDAQTPQGVLAVAALPKNHELDIRLHARVLVLESVQEPGNLGALVRSAAAFGFSVACLQGCVDLFNAKTARASQGGLFKTPLAWDLDFETLNAARREKAVSLYAATSHQAEEFSTVQREDRVMLALGNEGAGLSAELLAAADRRVRIAMRPGNESLNVGHAGAILMQHLQA